MPMSRDDLAAVRRDRSLSGCELPEYLGLSSEDIRAVIEAGLLSPARCHATLGLGWHPVKIAAWAWGLANTSALADRVALVLGRREPHWAPSAT